MINFARPLLAVSLAACLCSGAIARPVVIEQAHTLVNPDPQSWPDFGSEVAMNSGTVFVLGTRLTPELNSIGEVVDFRYAAALRFEKNTAGPWGYQGILDQIRREFEFYYFPHQFAVEGDLAVIELDGRPVTWTRDATGWHRGQALNVRTEDIEVSGNRIAISVGECDWSGLVFEPNGSGGYGRFGLPGPSRDGCDDEFWGGDLALSGDLAVLGNGSGRQGETQRTPLFRRDASGWTELGNINAAFENEFQGSVGVDASTNSVFVDTRLGAYLHRLNGWSVPDGRLQAPDAYYAAQVEERRSEIATLAGFTFVREFSADRGVHVINVYRGTTTAPYRHVAVLAAKNGGDIGESLDVVNTASGIWVAAAGNGEAYVFELPQNLQFTVPTSRQETFQAGNAANWSPIAGSQFTVVNNGGNQVLRQESVAGDARALLNNTSWQDQAIEADITPQSFNGADRWVGLVTRHQNANNFYYVTLRSSGTIQLRRMSQGAIIELARAPLAVALQRNYRVRLESIGTRHRVFVDGSLVLDVDDPLTPRLGKAGISTYKARADFDNVVVSFSPHYTLFRNDFATQYPGEWSLTGAGQWASANGRYAQSSVSGDARAIIGTPVEDQVVKVRVRPVAEAAGTSERWSGVIARFADVSNYYYLTLRNSGQVSIRKLVNGAIVPLASAPVAYAVGSTYELKLEAVGNQLRGYVNGQLLLQVTDGSHARGAGGLMTYRSAADFDDYLAYQP